MKISHKYDIIPDISSKEMMSRLKIIVIVYVGLLGRVRNGKYDCECISSQQEGQGAGFFNKMSPKLTSTRKNTEPPTSAVRLDDFSQVINSYLGTLAPFKHNYCVSHYFHEEQMAANKHTHIFYMSDRCCWMSVQRLVFIWVQTRVWTEQQQHLKLCYTSDFSFSPELDDEITYTDGCSHRCTY